MWEHPHLQINTFHNDLNATSKFVAVCFIYATSATTYGIASDREVPIAGCFLALYDRANAIKLELRISVILF